MMQVERKLFSSTFIAYFIAGADSRISTRAYICGMHSVFDSLLVNIQMSFLIFFSHSLALNNTINNGSLLFHHKGNIKLVSLVLFALVNKLSKRAV